MKRKLLKRRKRRNNYFRNRRRTDIHFNLHCNVSRLFRRCLKEIKDTSKIVLTALGYTIQQLKVHLEALFEPWMTWNNYGYGEGK